MEQNDEMTKTYRDKATQTVILDIDDSKHTVKAVINTFNVTDDQLEESLPGSFKKTFKENFNDIFWYVNHEPEHMPGITTELYETQKEAVAVGRFNMNKKLGAELYEDYKLFAEHGRSLQHSVRVMPIKWKSERMTDGSILWRVSEWKMREWSSLTQKGSNPITPVLELKNSPENLEILKAALNMSVADEKLKMIELKIQEIEETLKAAGTSTATKEPSKLISALDKLNKTLTTNI